MKDCIIECPRCGRQYHFQEIVMPKTVFKDLKSVLRNENGKIEDVVGDDSVMEDLYFCDKCDAPIKVKVKLSFEVSIEEKYDFTRDSSTVIK